MVINGVALGMPPSPPPTHPQPPTPHHHHPLPPTPFHQAPPGTCPCQNLSRYNESDEGTIFSEFPQVYKHSCSRNRPASRGERVAAACGGGWCCRGVSSGSKPPRTNSQTVTAPLRVASGRTIRRLSCYLAHKSFLVKAGPQIVYQ